MLDRLVGRSTVGWLRERDVDLLLCAELYGQGDFVALVGEVTGCPGASLVRACVSHMEAEGENDLVVILKHENIVVLLLIEDKMIAAFQPEQGVRYQTRAERWRKVDGVDRVLTMIVAPHSVLAGAHAQRFDVRLAFEDIVARLANSADARARFTAQALLDGIESARRGIVPDEKATSIWSTCWELAGKHAPNLNFAKPSDKPGLATWFYFRDALGFEASAKKYVHVVYKAERGEVDLQFRSTTPSELAAVAHGRLSPDMRIEKANKSTSIRLRVPKVDFNASAESQHNALVDGLLACERMRSFYVEHKEHLSSLTVLCRLITQ